MQKLNPGDHLSFFFSTGESVPPTYYLNEQTPNNTKMVVNGNNHSFACSFGIILEIWMET